MSEHLFKMSPYVTSQFLFNLVCIKAIMLISLQNITQNDLSLSIQFNMHNRTCVNILSEYHTRYLVSFYSI